MRKKSFTLLELLIVIAIVGILFAIFMPLIAETRQKSPVLQVQWEQMQDHRGNPFLHRTKVPDGWLIYHGGRVLTFVRDPKHTWALPKVEKE